LSVPEGDDKPAKYPVMFRTSDLVLISKSDLLPVLDDFSPERAKKYLQDIASTAPIMDISSKDRSGMPEWLSWIGQQIEQRRQFLEQHPVDSSHTHHHHHVDDHVHGHTHDHHHDHGHVHHHHGHSKTNENNG
jgi:hydrogenase nickel incorporation protein HypB